MTSNDRSLPALLRAAERRVNAHVFKRGGDDALASIPANRDRDVDMLLLEAADELEGLQHDIGQLQKAASAEANLAESLRAALRLILPLAKGYSPPGQSESARRTCNEWIAAAEAQLSDDPPVVETSAITGKQHVGDCWDAQEQIDRLRIDYATQRAEINQLRSALSWISVGEGRAGWRGHVVHANEALAGAPPAPSEASKNDVGTALYLGLARSVIDKILNTDVRIHPKDQCDIVARLHCLIHERDELRKSAQEPPVHLCPAGHVAEPLDLDVVHCKPCNWMGPRHACPGCGWTSGAHAIECPDDPCNAQNGKGD